MDSSRKRKAAPATPSTEVGATKKIRLLNSNHATPSQDKTQTVGQRLVEQLSRATDKTGRLIATEFQTLPKRSDLPEYYQLIKLPISVDTITAKIKRNGYPDISAIESDFKRMIQNAKEYNAPKSEVYEDAERIRKLVSNFMRSNNPAYERDPNYQAAPTPLPTNGTSSPNADELAGRTPGTARRASRSAQRPASRRTSAVTPARKPSRGRAKARAEESEEDEPEEEEDEEDEEEAEDEDEDAEGEDDEQQPEAEVASKKRVPVTKSTMSFKGKGFQEAQEGLIAELIGYLDEDGVELYSPFVYLPSRKLEDYYRLIKHPVSLQSLQKRTKGIFGRNPPTGISEFKTWDQLEEEVSYVWRNAQDYNEDESEMYELANEFKNHFELLLADAKANVELPAPKLKLGGPKPKVTLNLSTHRASPSPAVAAETETTRPRAGSQVVTNGSHGALQPTAGGDGATAANVNGRTSAQLSQGIKDVSPLPAVKSEGSVPASTSPALPVVNGAMPPPLTRPPSGSPFPALSAPTPQPVFIQLPPAPTRPYALSEAFLPSVTIATHPQLKISQPFSLEIPPHPTLTHHSTTATLPASHYFIQILPTISKSLSTRRPYKMFVTLNGTRLNQRDTTFKADVGQRTHAYEGSLASGVNRIEVEIAAAKQESNGEASSAGLDVEKVTVYANLMR